jgi:type III secretion protein V
LPTIPFLVLGGTLGFVAYRLLRSMPGARGVQMVAPVTGAGAGTPSRGVRAGRSGAEMPAPLLTPIAVELGAALSERLCPEGDGAPLAEQLTSHLRDRLFAELGVPLPLLRIRPSVTGVPPEGYVLRLNEVPLGRGQIGGVAGEPAERVSGREELARPDEADTLAAAVLSLLRRHGHEFIGIQETQGLLEALERSHPALVREVVPKLISPALLADVLKRLVEEGVSLRNLKDILGTLAEWGTSERDPVALTEHVRAALRRAITYRHASADGVLSAYLLDQMIEEAVREAIHKTATGSYLALEPQLSRDIIAAVGRAIATAMDDPGAPVPVILTSVDIRRYVRRLVETEHPRVAVLAYPELAPEARIQALGRIRI